MNMVVFFALFLLIPAIFLVLSIRNSQRKKALMKTGLPSLAHVLSINPTGTSVNRQPVMRLVLRIEQAGQALRQVEIRQLIDAGNMPRAGEEVTVMIDPARPDNILYIGLTSSVAAEASVTRNGQPGSTMTAAQLHDVLTLPPTLRQNGKLGVGTILTTDRVGDGLRITFEVDSVVDPKYTVTINQATTETPYKVGERAYVLIDPNDAQSAAMMPLSMLNGQRIDPRANRLDAMVLDPQLKAFGRKGQGTIMAAEKTVLHNAALAKMGMTRWHLKAHINPEDGSPAYDAEQDITMTSPEKVAAMCAVGKVVPVRYDANDPKTWCTDAVAMGFPDPYKDKNMWEQYKALAATMPADQSAG